LREERSQALRGAGAALQQRADHLAKLALVDAKIERIEIEEKVATRRRRVASKKRANAYLDGSPRDLPGHGEILRRYDRSSENKPRRSIPKGIRIVVQQRADLERLISARYGGQLPNDDAGQDDLWIAAQLTRRLSGDISKNVVAWARRWAPWCSEAWAREIAAKACDQPEPYRFTADILAEKQGLTYAERQALGITAIGAIDVDREERERRRRQRSRANEKQKRRENGAMPRELYERGSTNSTRPWEREGISRATWYRRQRASRVSRVQKLSATVGDGLERVGARTISKWEIGSSHGRIDCGFQPSEGLGDQRETISRPADCEAVKPVLAPVSTAPRAAVDASIALSAPCAHARSPCARSRCAEQPPKIKDGSGQPQNDRPSIGISELAYEAYLRISSRRGRKRFLRLLFSPTGIQKPLTLRPTRTAAIQQLLRDYESMLNGGQPV
jgi:hypothetical protein